jgi:predicted metal-dependent peptidase
MTTSQLVNQDARLRVMAARIIAQSKWPYLANILFSLKLIETNRIQTLAVDDGWRMYFNPEFVLEHEAEPLSTMVLHEALHCMLQHGPRFTAIHQPLGLHPNWNIAGDLGINSSLDQANMPWGEFEPVRFSQMSEVKITTSMSTEQIFFRIMAYLEENPEKAVWVQDCGSVSGGFARDYELPRGDSEYAAIKQDQQDVLRDQVAQAVLEHLKKFPGTVPGAIARWADELLNPKVNWRKELAGTFRASLANISGRRDYLYTRPSRRQSAMRQGSSELILPAMRKPAPPAVAVIIDTSGSISQKEITEFLTEVDGIARANGIAHGLFIIPCDAAVGPIQKLKSRASIESLELPGGGGTDMGVGIAAASIMMPVPPILIILTDGVTPWPETVSQKIDKVIVCLTIKESKSEVPDWAQVVIIEEDS